MTQLLELQLLIMEGVSTRSKRNTQFFSQNAMDGMRSASKGGVALNTFLENEEYVRRLDELSAES